MTTSVTVNIVGGTEQENTTAVSIGNVRWGKNGTANFGAAQNVAGGNQTLTVYKTTQPTQLSNTVNVQGAAMTANITVNTNDISVN
ncbi:MAG: hypothetical protein PHF31_07220 [Methylobacter sp.]|nr:hypothetical protein [Methylobacter sp.]